MNTERLVDLITEKVMEELNRGDGTVPAPPPASPQYSNVSVDSHDPDTCERCRNWGVPRRGT